MDTPTVFFLNMRARGNYIMRRSSRPNSAVNRAFCTVISGLTGPIFSQLQIRHSLIMMDTALTKRE
jgi:hypothetical protein